MPKSSVQDVAGSSTIARVIYRVNPKDVGKVDRARLEHFQPASTATYIPTTLMPMGREEDLCEDSFELLSGGFEIDDDVWSRTFLSTTVMFSAVIFKTDDLEAISTFVLDRAGEALPTPGPYVLHRHTGHVFSVDRLFPDYHEAFLCNVLETQKSPLFLQDSRNPGYIAVPSRLSHHGSTGREKPLAGMRFAVKDIIDVIGCKTGCGSSAWTIIQQPSTKNAVVVQQLLDAGAVLVGKTKTSQFAEGADPLQWIDYKCPYNPRGDGYQKPSSSSTGSAVAVAAYEWLDFTIGTDTGGSIRAPAGVNGVYGLRPSTSFADTTGVYSVAPLLDTVGIFARSVDMVHRVQRYIMSPLYLPRQPQAKQQFKLLYPVRQQGARAGDSYRWFPYPGDTGEAETAERMMENVIREIEQTLGCERLVFGMEELWEQTKPEGQLGSLDEATGIAYSVLTTYPQSITTIPNFLDSYANQHAGRKPYIEPIALARQTFGRSLSQSDYDAAVAVKDMFAKWIDTVLLAAPTNDDDAETSTVPILVFPQSFGIPAYRDVYTEPTIVFSRFSTYSIAYLGGCPDYTVPIGEVPYLSRVTGREEYLPVSLSVVSRPGNDFVLSAVLERLAERGVLKEVRVGRRMFGEDHDEQV
ncbi:MAG: hypothetical protein M1833_007341 [Piccolia ochrophora]|nr:MAG: hypothetical protein M1833_007341 [Piccolia ochrophora]